MSRAQICSRSRRKKLTNTLTQAYLCSGIIVAWNNVLQAKWQSWNSILLQWQLWWTFNYYGLPLLCNYSFFNSVKKLVKNKRFFFCSIFLVLLTAQRIPHSLKSLGFICILQWSIFFGNKSPLGYNCVCYLFRRICSCFYSLFPSVQCGEYSFVSLETFIQVKLENFTCLFRLPCSYLQIHSTDGEHFPISGHELMVWLSDYSNWCTFGEISMMPSHLGRYTGCIILFRQSICEWTLQPWFLSLVSLWEVCSLQSFYKSGIS